jgi:chromatin segregation and condensation protein Rec8/ScpA/Scc1 (kleisin family)
MEGLAPETPLRRCSGWTSSFVASPELAKQGEVTLQQGDALSQIQVSPAPEKETVSSA